MRKTGRKRYVLKRNRLLAVLVVLSMLMSVFSPFSGIRAKAENENSGSQTGTLLEAEELDPSTLGVKKLGEFSEEEGEVDQSAS